MKYPFPLRYSILTALGFFILLLAGVDLWSETREADRRIEEEALAQIQALGNRTSSRTEYYFNRGDPQAAERDIALLATEPHLSLSALFDESDRVITATDPALEGGTLADALTQSASDITHKARETLSAQVILSEDGNTLMGAFPFRLGLLPGELRPSRIGSLYMEFDLQAQKQASLAGAFQRVGLTVGIATLFLSLTWFYLNLIITRRANTLIAATRAMAKGDLSRRASLHGSDELAELSQAFNRMADEIQRQTESLRVSEERLNLALTGANDGLWDWNVQTGEAYFSPRWKGMIGYAEDELPNTYEAWEARLHPDDKPSVLKELQEHFDGESRPYAPEFRMMTKAGGWTWIQARGRVVERDREDRPLRMAGTHTDITERKQAEEALREKETQIRALSDNLPNGYVYQVDFGLKGETRRFNYVSAGVERLHGISAQQALDDPMTLYGQMLEEDRSMVAKMEASALASMTTFKAEARYRMGGGQIGWMLLTSTPRKLDNNHIVWDGIALDITERKQAEEALQSSERAYANLLKNITGAVYRCRNDKDWTVEYISEGCIALTGYRPEEIIESRVTSLGALMHPHDVEPIWEKCQVNLAARKACDNEYRIFHRTGEMRWVRDQAQGVYSDAGELLFIEGLITDITERKQAEDALRASETKFRNIIDASPVPYALNDERQNITYLNPAFTQTFGYDLEDIPTLADWWPRAYPDIEYRQWVAETWQARLDKAKQSGAPFEPVELNIRGKDNVQRTAIVGAASLTESFADVHLVTLFDITGRKQAQEKLEQQNQRLKALREIDTAILAADSVENIVGAALSHIRELIECRRASLTLIDWETNEALIFDVRETHETLIPKGTRIPLAALFPDMLKTLSQNQPALINDLTALPDPQPQIQMGIKEGLRSLCVLPLFSRSGLIGAFSMSSEIPGFFDEEKINLGREVANQVAIAITQNNLLNALRELNAELEGRVRDRTAQLVSANKELEAFTYSVSHDLRAPLRAVHGFSQALLNKHSESLGDQGRHYLNRIQENITRMGQLIDDLLSLARLSRRKMKQDVVNLTQLAREIDAELRAQEPERQVTFEVEDQVEGRGDAGLIRIVLQNLLGNAWKFTSTRAEARIQFGLLPSPAGRGAGGEGETVYCIRDNGVGFDMAYANKLFGAFQRLHSDAEFPGTGIGLATVQRIVHRHGGRIWAEAEPEKGAAFYFTLG